MLGVYGCNIRGNGGEPATLRETTRRSRSGVGGVTASDGKVPGAVSGKGGAAVCEGGDEGGGGEGGGLRLGLEAGAGGVPVAAVDDDGDCLEAAAVALGLLAGAAAVEGLASPTPGLPMAAAAIFVEDFGGIEAKEGGEGQMSGRRRKERKGARARSIKGTEGRGGRCRSFEGKKHAAAAARRWVCWPVADVRWYNLPLGQAII